MISTVPSTYESASPSFWKAELATAPKIISLLTIRSWTIPSCPRPIRPSSRCASRSKLTSLPPPIRSVLKLPRWSRRPPHRRHFPHRCKCRSRCHTSGNLCRTLRHCSHHSRRLPPPNACSPRHRRCHRHQPARKSVRDVSAIHQRICEFQGVAHLYVWQGWIGSQACNEDDWRIAANELWAERYGEESWEGRRSGTWRNDGRTLMVLLGSVYAYPRGKCLGAFRRVSLGSSGKREEPVPGPK
jgi:hypothetical protein